MHGPVVVGVQHSPLQMFSCLSFSPSLKNLNLEKEQGSHCCGKVAICLLGAWQVPYAYAHAPTSLHTVLRGHLGEGRQQPTAVWPGLLH